MADKSTAPRLASLATLLAIAAAGCTSTGDTGAGQPASQGPSPAVPGSASVAPSGVTSDTIPASAFLEVPAKQRASDRIPAEGSEAVPKLCGGELAAGAGAISSAAMKTVYKGPDDPAESVPHGVLFQTIRLYGGDSAAAFMDRAEAGLKGCRSYKGSESTVQVKTAPLTGSDADEGLTIDLVRPQLDLPGNPVEGEQTNRIVVMRFGAVVTVLYDGEYERTSSVPAIVNAFVGGATEAIEAWRG